MLATRETAALGVGAVMYLDVQAVVHALKLLGLGATAVVAVAVMRVRQVVRVQVERLEIPLQDYLKHLLAAMRGRAVQQVLLVQRVVQVVVVMALLLRHQAKQATAVLGVLEVALEAREKNFLRPFAPVLTYKTMLGRVLEAAGQGIPILAMLAGAELVVRVALLAVGLAENQMLQIPTQLTPVNRV